MLNIVAIGELFKTYKCCEAKRKKAEICRKN